MADNKINLRKRLTEYKMDFDLLEKIPCSQEENKEYEQLLKEGKPLPEDVFPYIYDDGEVSTSEFYTVYEAELSEAETMQYLTFKKLYYLHTIKICVVFFTVLTVIGLVAGIFAFLMMT